MELCTKPAHRQPRVWTDEIACALREDDVSVFPRAELHGSMLLGCVQLSKATTTESYWALLNTGTD